MNAPLLRLFCLAVLATLAMPSPARAATFQVPSAQYPTIQAGIDAAQSGDTVVVGDGTYTGDGNRDLDFNGKSLTIKSVNGAAKTIIDCQGSAASPHRGFYLHTNEFAVIIDGFTVENGFIASGTTSSGYGGGAYIYSDAGPVVMGNGFGRAPVTGPTNSAFGGGVYIFSSSGGSIVITNCTFRGDTASGGSVSGKTSLDFGGGGGIYLFSGGGGSASVTNCVFSGNTATTSSDYSEGGGAYIYSGGNTTLTNCTFHDNTASGIIASRNATSGSTTSGTTGAGGGVFVFSVGSTAMTNCTFCGNTVKGDPTNGGGAYIHSIGSALVTDCTFSDNSAISSAFGDGGGAYGAYIEGVKGKMAVTNCIGWGDKAEKSPLAAEFTSSPPHSIIFTNSDIQGGVPGEGNINEDPLFVNAAAGDLHLKPDSPCFGMGTPNGASTTDKDGKTRPNPPSMGAYEGAPPNEVTSQTIEGFQVTVASDHDMYRAGDPVRVDVRLKNMTNQPRQMPYPDQTEAFLNIMVQREDGKPVALTAYGAQGYLPPDFKKPYRPSYGPKRLELALPPLLAHQELKYRILVNRLYDMTQQGVYLVSIKRLVPQQVGKNVAVLASPPLRIVVSEEADTLSPDQTNPVSGGLSSRTQFSIGQVF